MPALSNVSFQAFEGESRAILGAAGSGKTVLLKAALGLVKPDSGKVFAFGQELTAMREKELFDIRARIGMLFQESALFDSLTIEENVAYPLAQPEDHEVPKPEVNRRVAEALDFVELGGTLEKFPAELSGGMRRRAAIARAVVTAPPADPLRFAHGRPGPHHRAHHHGAAHQGKGYGQDHHAHGHLPLPGRQPDGEFPLQFGARAAGTGPPRREQDLSTTFMVLQEGRLIFEGGQDLLEASQDPYISRFVKQRG